MVTTLTRDGMLTPTEAAVCLGKSAPTVYRLIQAGELPAVKRGGHYFIDSDELRRWETERQPGEAS